MMISNTPRLMLALAISSILSACVDKSFYVKAEKSGALTAGVSELQKPDSIEVTVTFLSDGRLSSKATAVLYDAVVEGLKNRGIQKVTRVGDDYTDVSGRIASHLTQAVEVPDDLLASDVQRSAKALKPTGAVPQLWVLVNDLPDVSDLTSREYFLAGLSMATYSVHKPTDRYDITIAYLDAFGVERIYKSHQDLIFAAISRVFPQDQADLAGMERYTNSRAAFDGIVDNSINGVRHGDVDVGPVVPGMANSSTAFR